VAVSLVSPIDGLITAQATGPSPSVTFTEVDIAIPPGEIVFSDVFEAVSNGAPRGMTFDISEAGDYDVIASCGYQNISNYGCSIGTTLNGNDLFDGGANRLSHGVIKYSNVTLPAQTIYIVWWGGGSSPSRNIDCRVQKA